MSFAEAWKWIVDRTASTRAVVEVDKEEVKEKEGASGDPRLLQSLELESKVQEVPNTKKKPACLSNLPTVCVISVLQYLDMLSLTAACSSGKALQQDGTLVAKCVWNHLVAANLSSPFITLPVVEANGQKAPNSIICAVCRKKAPLRCGKCKSVSYCSRACQEANWKEEHKWGCKALMSSKSGGGEKSLPIATHDLFLKAKKSQDVLIMGGAGQDGGGVQDVTKMIISQDGTIRFKESMPMLAKRKYLVCLYHQGEVFSISSGSVERLDTLTKTRTFIETRLPTIAHSFVNCPNSEKMYNFKIPGDLYRAGAAMFGNKLLVL